MPKATYEPFDVEAALTTPRDAGTSYPGWVLVIDDLSEEEIDALDQRRRVAF